MSAQQSARLSAEDVGFTWWRARDVRWAEWEHREAMVPQYAAERAGETWLELVREDSFEYRQNPWMIVWPGESYEPLREHPALFREFASLPYRQDAYLDFAREYGALTGRHERDLPDRLVDWAREHHYLRRGVELLDALPELAQRDAVSEDLARLGIVLEAAQTTNGLPVPNWRFAFLPFTDDDAACAMFGGSIDRQGAAQHWEDGNALAFNRAGLSLAEAEKDGRRFGGVQVKRDASGREIVQAVLSHTVTEALRRHGVAPTVRPDGRVYGPGLRLSFEVPHLAAGMWLQLLIAIDGNRTYKQCPVCGRWWDETYTRTHKEVCSDKCRAKRSYDERKRKATEAKGGEENE